MTVHQIGLLANRLANPDTAYGAELLCERLGLDFGTIDAPGGPWVGRNGWYIRGEY